MKHTGMAVLLYAALSCHAQQDGGGREVRIALFSAAPPRAVMVTAAGPGAWWARCGTCARQPLTVALHMPAVSEIVAGGPLSVRDEAGGQVRSANGKWHLRADGETIRTVLTLPSERYVSAVLMGETLPDEPLGSLRAMAVVARTFAMTSPASREHEGTMESDVCDSTACQAMKLSPVSGAVGEAVRSTAGETLWFHSQRAQVFFSATCGGITESAGAIWPMLAKLPYLRSVPDPYCSRVTHASWHAEVPLASVQKLAAMEGWHVPAHIVTASVAERTASQRAHTIVFSDSRGERAFVSAPALRLAVGRALGWDSVRSDAYDLRVRDGLLVFDGHGHGHGVGLCQQGAIEMARLGKTYREILAFYFLGTAVRITPADTGWQRTSEGGLTLISTASLTQNQLHETAEAWAWAQARFPAQHPITPVVVFTPTTEVFRQRTSQPGWQLASTSGSTVVLQPGTVLAANRVSLLSTLRHEMLHVAVEAGANAGAPLWLREGLVEVLAGDAASAAPVLSPTETERLLQNSGSRRESQSAHQAAGARTRRLVERYGLAMVRDWLNSGVSAPSD